MLNTLSSIGKELNSKNITWAVGASLLLSTYGFISKPNDIDIFIDINDISEADKILSKLGTKKEFEKSSTYSTKFFYEYTIDNVDIDVMSGFAINHSEGIFEYIFDSKSISNFKTINGIKIPFTSLEDWYVIYQLIPNREYKVEMIEKYLLSNKINHPELLERSLLACLPKNVIERIKKIIL